MSWPPDYHLHTPLCRHATGEPVAYARNALARGLTEIGFSDHSPMARDDFDEWRMRLDQLDDYVAAVEHARREVPELTIRLALEVDYLPGHESWIRSLAKRHPWDYFIGSVHYLDDAWDVDNPHKLEQWRHRDVDGVWDAYVQRLTAAAASGLFDIMGHIDLPKKFGHRGQQSLAQLYEPFMQAARAADVAIELNTAGLRKPCQEIYPARELLASAQQHGVAITFGSDAHAPEEVSQDFAAALTLARSVGYREARTFQKGQKAARSL